MEIPGDSILRGGFLDFDVLRHVAEQNGVAQQPYIRGG